MGTRIADPGARGFLVWDEYVYADDLAGANWASPGAARDKAAVLAEVSAAGNVLAYIGPVAPRNNAEARLVVPAAPWRCLVPAGSRLWLRRNGGADVAAGVTFIGD